jgi:DNA-binding transcriptional MocR family regulator
MAISGRISARLGRGSRAIESAMTANVAATTARADEMNHGDRCFTATRLAGNVTLNAVTPSQHSNEPTHARGADAVRPSGTPGATELMLVALPVVPTGNDSATSRVRLAIESEVARLPAGARLASSRQLVAQHRTSARTVHEVVSALVARGVLVSHPGRGTFVVGRDERGASGVDLAASPQPDTSWQTVALDARPPYGERVIELLADPDPDVIDLRSGYLDASLQPTGLLSAAASRAARRPGAWSRVPAEGLVELRRWFANDCDRTVSEHDVLVAFGGQAALSITLRSLVEPGGRVVMESPTYVGGLELARSLGLEVVPVPTDGDGVNVDALDDVLERSGAHCVVLQPTCSNPTGVALAMHRRAALLSVLEHRRAFAVCDDFVRDLVDDPAPSLMADDRHGHIVAIRSLTKSAAAGLRVAGVIARGPARNRIRSVAAMSDFFVPAMLQHTALDVVTAASWPRHLNNTRAELAIRRNAAMRQLDAMQWRFAPPVGGAALWVQLPDGTDDLDLVRRAQVAGVLVSPGRIWHPTEPDNSYIRVSTAVSSAPNIVRGLQQLGELVGA